MWDRNPRLTCYQHRGVRRRTGRTVQVGRHRMAGLRIHKGQNTKYYDIVYIYMYRLFMIAYLCYVPTLYPWKSLAFMWLHMLQLCIRNCGICRKRCNSILCFNVTQVRIGKETGEIRKEKQRKERNYG